MKKVKFLSIFILILLSVNFHFTYEKIPNFITSILFPVNESIWEHMKIIATPILFYMIIEYLIFKKANIKYNNFLLAHSISIIISIFVYLIIYLPIDLFFGHNLIVSIILLVLVFMLSQIISYYIEKSKHFKNSNLIGLILFLIIYFVFLIFTYYPPRINLFYDTLNLKYGINIYTL